MAIRLDALSRAAQRYTGQRIRTLAEAKSQGRHTAFLCHSHADATYIKGLLQLLQEAGLDLYVDWEDTSMPPTPNKETAVKIQRRIVELDLFLFLATPSSMESRWCPWEIGYADGRKPTDKIVVIQTVDSSGRSVGNEYLQLYQRIDAGPTLLELFQPGSATGRALRWL